VRGARWHAVSFRMNGAHHPFRRGRVCCWGSRPLHLDHATQAEPRGIGALLGRLRHPSSRGPTACSPRPAAPQPGRPAPGLRARRTCPAGAGAALRPPLARRRGDSAPGPAGFRGQGCDARGWVAPAERMDAALCASNPLWRQPLAARRGRPDRLFLFPPRAACGSAWTLSIRHARR
jgi:hypothetical protein